MKQSTAPKLSKGHIGTIAGLEYFKTETGDLYRARVSNPIDTLTGYRQGARWEMPPHMADNYFEMIASM